MHCLSSDYTPRHPWPLSVYVRCPSSDCNPLTSVGPRALSIIRLHSLTSVGLRALFSIGLHSFDLCRSTVLRPLSDCALLTFAGLSVDAGCSPPLELTAWAAHRGGCRRVQPGDDALQPLEVQFIALQQTTPLDRPRPLSVLMLSFIKPQPLDLHWPTFGNAAAFPIVGCCRHYGRRSSSCLLQEQAQPPVVCVSCQLTSFQPLASVKGRLGQRV